MKYGFGIDLGGTTVKLAYFDETGAMLDKWEIPTVTENSGKQILPDIAAAVRGYLTAHAIPDSDILGLGIGVPGPVDREGVVNKCINLGWGVFNIAQELSGLTGFPVVAGNDANVAAMGEFWKGGGIVIENNLLFGAHGSGAEIGHMVLNPQETIPCNCGNYGCVEQYCSATGIARLGREALAASKEDSTLRTVEKLDAKAIFDAGKAGDKLALQVLDRYYNYLGQFLGSLCSVINPEVVVLGGGVCKAGQILLDGVEPYFHKYVFHAASKVRFTIATLGNDAGAYGAFKLALDKFL